MTYSVRIAVPEDVPAVTALFEATYPPLFAAGYGPEVLAAALPRMTKANPRLLASGNFFVATRRDGEIIGCGGWSKERPGTSEFRDGIGHIRHFATHPDWLRRGIGRAIIDRCSEQARAADIARFECYSSLVAVGFYRAIGFSVESEMTLDLGDGVSIKGMLMRREIG